MHRNPLTRSVPLALALCAVAPTPALAQEHVIRNDGRARYLAANVLIGTATALARARISNEPLWPALRKGVVGGLVMNGGVSLIGTESPSLRFLGLQTVAVGASIARNADDGVPLLSDLTFPVYPFFVRVRAADAPKLSLRLSTMSTAYIVSTITSAKHSRVDWRETLITGAPVFRSAGWRLPSAHCPPPCEGSFARHDGGLVVYSASAGTDYDLQRTLAHESMHLAQHTRDVLLHAQPTSDALLVRLGKPGAFVSRFLVLDGFLPLKGLSITATHLQGVPARQSWYEREARAFAPGGEFR